MLNLVNITKTYFNKNNINIVALDKINLSFKERGLVFILGKSGSGKSTLLNIIGGLDIQDEGEMFIKGISNKSFQSIELDDYRNKIVGFVFQEFHLLENFTIEKNLALVLELQGKKAVKKIINNSLDKVGLTGYSKMMPNELSGGQKQRVAIARALIKDPDIILADEPTGNLDENTGKKIIELLKEISQEKLVIVVTHDGDTAYQFGDRVIELSDGKIKNET